MKVDARNRDHRARYRIFLDGVDITTAVQEADDLAHEVVVVVRDPQGKPVRGNGGLLKATVRGHVVIVSNSNLPAMPSRVQ